MHQINIFRRRPTAFQFLPANAYMNLSNNSDCFCLEIQIYFVSLRASEASRAVKTVI